MKLQSIMISVMISFAAPSDLIAQTQSDGSGPVEATDEADPPPTKAEELCNPACQMAKIKLVPGGGGGISAGKETEIMGGVELGITRPAAESIQMQNMQ